MQAPSRVTRAIGFASVFRLMPSCYECTLSVGLLFPNSIVLCRKLTLSHYNLIVASTVVARCTFTIVRVREERPCAALKSTLGSQVLPLLIASKAADIDRENDTK